MSLTGTTDLAKYPPVHAFGGQILRAHGVRVDVVAGEALDGGDEVGADALRHEVVVVVGGRVQRPRSAVGAHRDARHRLDATGDHESSQPERTFCAAMFTASKPDAQKRLICTPPTVSGSFAPLTAMRAMSAP